MEKYIVMPQDVLSASPEAQVVLLNIASYYNVKERCAYPSIGLIAEMSHLGENTVRCAILELENKGLIESYSRKRTDGGNTSNEYRFPWFPRSKEDRKTTFIVCRGALTQTKYAVVILFRLLVRDRIISINELANALDVNSSTIKRAMRGLKKGGLIVCTATKFTNKHGKEVNGKNMYGFPWMPQLPVYQTSRVCEADMGHYKDQDWGNVVSTLGAHERRKQLYMERYHNFIISSSWRRAVQDGWEDEEEQFQDYIHMLDAVIEGKCEKLDCHSPQLWSKAKKVLIQLWRREVPYKNKNVKIEIDELRELILCELSLDSMSYALTLYSNRLAEQPPIRQMDVYLSACIVTALLHYDDDILIYQKISNNCF